MAKEKENVRRLFESEIVKHMITLGIEKLIKDAGYTGIDQLSLDLFVEDKFEEIVKETMKHFDEGD